MAAGAGAPFDFLLSGFREEHEEKELLTKIKALGGRAKSATTYDVSKCTHVISYRPIRNCEKFLCGVASGKWILKPGFITDSFTRGKWQAESMYEWSEGDVSENDEPGLLTAPRRWREKIAASRHGAFHGWKVLLHVTNHKDTYRRVLEAGGGQCVSVIFPIKEPAGLVSLVTHVIVEKYNEKDIQCLEAKGIHCLLPEFIAEYLFQKNTNMTQFHESSALITPPEAIRQRNTEAPTKKDRDTFLKPTLQTNSSGGETPGSMMSLAEEGTSSDSGSSVKRKLDLLLDSPSEPLQILKKRKNYKGETPLHVACIKNNITKVRELLNEPDIDINARDHAEWTPLHKACKHGHTACVKELLEFTPGKRKITNSGSESRSMQTLDLLSAPSKCGTTPLHDAVFNNKIEVVKLLVEAGGTSLLTVKNKAGYTPVDMALLKEEDMKEAIRGQRSEVSNLPAIDKEKENTSVSRSTIAHHSRRSSTRKTKVNCKNPKASVSCSNIAHQSPKASPRMTNVNHKNRKGEMPLHEACMKNDIPRLRELLNEPDNDVNARDHAGWTPLHEACIHGHTACVKELLEFTPGKRKITNSGSESRSMQTLDLLAAPSKCGTTPLHDAVYNNKIEVVKLLVEAGGTSLLHVKNKKGYTPVDMATTEDMKEATQGQRSEVSNLPAIDKEKENNASTSKAASVRRSPRLVKRGSRLQSNTKVKDGSRETLPSSKPNSGKDEGSAMAKLPSEKDDASVTPVPPRKMDKLLHYVAESLPMDKVLSLGTALEIEYVQIEHFIAKNVSGSTTCIYEGTLKMLHVWTSKQKDNDIQALLAALEQVGLNKLSRDVKLGFIK